MLMMPLKQVEPFVIRVDNSTGIVDVVPVYTGGTAKAYRPSQTD
jgi:type IV secretion system protein VirB8